MEYMTDIFREALHTKFRRKNRVEDVEQIDMELRTLQHYDSGAVGRAIGLIRTQAAEQRKLRRELVLKKLSRRWLMLGLELRKWHHKSFAYKTANRKQKWILDMKLKIETKDKDAFEYFKKLGADPAPPQRTDAEKLADFTKAVNDAMDEMQRQMIKLTEGLKQ